MPAKSFLLFFFLLYSYTHVIGQILGDYFVENRSSIPSEKSEYYVVLSGSDTTQFEYLGARQISAFTYLVSATPADLQRIRDKFLVKYFQKATRAPKTEAQIRQYNFQINEISAAQHIFPNVSGDGLAVSVKENSFNISDFDIAGRANTDEFTSPLVELHATEMATLIAGAGNSYLNGQGVVTAVDLYSASFQNLLPEPDDYYAENGITVQNHSYGVGVEAFYGVESVAYDASTIANPALVHSFSVGNSGRSSGGGSYQNLTSYGTITGSFKQAKNVILSSSSDSLGVIPDLNSRGPAYDGRVKPDLVAFGGEGTSESAALVSGAAAFLQDVFFQENGFLPRSDLIRSLLIVGAEDMLAEGPDFISGYGSLNLKQSSTTLAEEWFFSGEVSSGASQTFSISLPDRTSKLRIALVWNDPPAEVGVAKALVNDLDLKVLDGASLYLPWVLDGRAQLSSLQAPAIRRRDSLNNVELISLDPQTSTVEVTILGYEVSGTQAFSLAYFLEKENRFEFIYPTSSDPVEAGRQLSVYWNANITSGSLEASYDGAQWQVIEPTLDVSKEREAVLIPDGVSTGRLRLVAQDSIYLSDVFLISRKPELKVDLNCEEELVLRWRDVAAENYQIQEYGQGIMETIGQTSDTIFRLDRETFDGTLYRVLPERSEGDLLRSFLVNVDQQNVGCYINSFLASTAFRQVELTVRLSGLSDISEVKILKSENGKSFNDFLILEALLEQSFIDPSPADGVTRYLLEVETLTGEIFQEEMEVFYADESPVIFPTIITDGIVYLVSPLPSGRFLIFNQQGLQVAERALSSEVSFFGVADLPAGLYHYKIYDREDQRLRQGKFVIR